MDMPSGRKRVSLSMSKGDTVPYFDKLSMTPKLKR